MGLMKTNYAWWKRFKLGDQGKTPPLRLNTQNHKTQNIPETLMS